MDWVGFGSGVRVGSSLKVGRWSRGVSGVVAWERGEGCKYGEGSECGVGWDCGVGGSGKKLSVIFLHSSAEPAPWSPRPTSTPTCFGARSSSSAVTTAVVALLFSAMGCRVIDSPATTWTVKSVRDTLSSSTVTVFSAKMESDSGDNTCGNRGSTEVPSCPFPGKGTHVKTPYAPVDGPEVLNIDHKEAHRLLSLLLAPH